MIEGTRLLTGVHTGGHLFTQREEIGHPTNYQYVGSVFVPLQCDTTHVALRHSQGYCLGEGRRQKVTARKSGFENKNRCENQSRY